MRFVVVSDRWLSTLALVRALRNIPYAVIVAEVDDLDAAHPREDAPWWGAAERLRGLSPRELEVLHLLGFGMSNHHIARRLHVTERTAKSHVASILKKLELESRLQAGLIALAFALSPAELRGAAG